MARGAAGETAACVGWTGDIVQLRADNPDLGYALPQTGCTLWSDNFVIPAMAGTHGKVQQAPGLS